jgi:hypothetical protein
MDPGTDARIADTADAAAHPSNLARPVMRPSKASAIIAGIAFLYLVAVRGSLSKLGR